MTSLLEAKQHRLDDRLRGLGSVLVAYSGGVDSAYLAWRARAVLGDGMKAVLADSPSLARVQLDAAVGFAREQDIPLEIVATRELDKPEYARNDAQRCFFCKHELFTVMKKVRERLGHRHLAYGMNRDDRGDFRPGQRAAELHGAVAPLAEAELDKQDIRDLARRAGLAVWDRPASPCLSSRVAYGLPVTTPVLLQVEQAEACLREMGFRQFRVRHHGTLARLEIAREEMAAVLALDRLDTISARLKALGFQHVALECGGFQSGSMNRTLSAATLRAATPGHGQREDQP